MSDCAGSAGSGAAPSSAPRIDRRFDRREAPCWGCWGVPALDGEAAAPLLVDSVDELVGDQPAPVGRCRPIEVAINDDVAAHGVGTCSDPRWPTRSRGDRVHLNLPDVMAGLAVECLAGLWIERLTGQFHNPADVRRSLGKVVEGSARGAGHGSGRRGLSNRPAMISASASALASAALVARDVSGTGSADPWLPISFAFRPVRPS